MKRSLRLILAVVLTITISSSCKKNNPDPVVPENNSILGMWVESQTATLYRAVLFSNDGVFRQYVVVKNNNSSQGFTLSGTYTIDGDKISARVTEEIFNDGSNPGVKTTINTTLFDKGTFSIKNNLLQINYVSYPADAPVATTMLLKRELLPL